MKTAYKTFPLFSVAVDPATNMVYPSTYDIFTVGAGYLDIAAALANHDQGYGVALSPTVVYNTSLAESIPCRHSGRGYTGLMLRTSVAVLLCSLAVALLVAAQQPVACPVDAPCPVCDPPRTADPLTALRDGNSRFIKPDPKHFHQSVECGKRLSCCQKPFAVILSCSDSRVPPDVLFDQGIGDLFVVRVAGNVATPDALGSIEYAVDHLDAKLVVVMGHQRCGAVQAAFCPKPGPHLDVLWDLIRPSVAHPLPSCEHHEQVDPAQWDLAVRKNISNMAAMVTKDLRGRAGVSVAAAYYNLDDGKVAFLK